MKKRDELIGNKIDDHLVVGTILWYDYELTSSICTL